MWPQVVGLYVAALMPGYTRHGTLGVLATLPRMLLLLPPWLAATVYVVALSIAVATGAAALLGLQVSASQPHRSSDTCKDMAGWGPGPKAPSWFEVPSWSCCVPLLLLCVAALSFAIATGAAALLALRVSASQGM